MHTLNPTMPMLRCLSALVLIGCYANGQSNNVIANDDCTIHFDVWVGEGCYDDGDDFYPSLTLDIPVDDSCRGTHPWVTTYGDEIVDDVHMHAILDMLDEFLDALCEDPLAASVFIDYEDNACVQLPTVFGDIYMVGNTCAVGKSQVVTGTQHITYEEADENADDQLHDSVPNGNAEIDMSGDSVVDGNGPETSTDSSSSSDADSASDNRPVDDGDNSQLTEDQLDEIRNILTGGVKGSNVNTNAPYIVHTSGNHGVLEGK
ncbi:hypothetical protein SARC_03595 [Sphaeroforma arctica JP610]|uniref:Uncharacterized protein n=1 Tax=Sphaeroforma arctica JP610 TaxID=667725 RepID=A0A0L0G7H5_9EUKA|nr:hypothetical protein SARC_03595 [Sphaeroforma arctica JP610]KNC84173.1 hypothetical protein SARC_03595 [Sphaeroforma arctica JP610]|eukprot:XP_014158075.1 hypothetical protein SARC_03595 [Sphaeroforma arctica JP610]